MQEKVDEKIASLIRVVGAGGHYLLNIGSCGDGSVVELERDVLYGIGERVKSNPLEYSSSWKEDPNKAAFLPKVSSAPLIKKGMLSYQNATPLFVYSSLTIIQDTRV